MKKAWTKETIIQPNSQQISEEVRLNKYLTMSGFCSRREADRLIEAQRVTIDDEIATMGTKVKPNQLVKVDNNLIQPTFSHIYIIVNKPIGITCTLDKEIEGNLDDFMNYPQRIFQVGRLDKDSSGLLLLTSNGDIVNKILSSENNHEKEYIVTVNQDLTSTFINTLRNGVEITNTVNKTRVVTKKCSVVQHDKRSFSIILTQGYNRQIRRMCSELGYRVTALHRKRIMHIKDTNLKIGQWRYLTKEEEQQLLTTIEKE